MKESNTAGISGVHLGHQKSCARDAFLSNFESYLSQITYGSRASVDTSWSKSITCIIKKKVQEEHINNLCSIVLTKADFNFNNKIFGRTTLPIAEEKKIIVPEQYQNRKGKSYRPCTLQETYL